MLFGSALSATIGALGSALSEAVEVLVEELRLVQLLIEDVAAVVPVDRERQRPGQDRSRSLGRSRASRASCGTLSITFQPE